MRPLVQRTESSSYWRKPVSLIVRDLMSMHKTGAIEDYNQFSKVKQVLSSQINSARANIRSSGSKEGSTEEESEPTNIYEHGAS